LALLSTKTGLPSFAAADNAIINYFTDGGFERGSNGVIPSGWVQYNDGAVAIPVDGTGGSAVAQVTMLCTTSSPIRGTLSAVISKDANNRQGVGYSFPFTISNADKGITAGVNFELLTSANYVSGDMVFYIYDVTNSILITPRSVSLPALPSYGKFFSDYGLTAGTSYRFILHIATTSALAYTVTLDTMVNTTTRVAVPGSIVAEFTYTTTGITSSGGGAVTAGTGGSTTDVLRWRQVGSSIEMLFSFYWGTAGTAFGTGTYYKFNLPTGLNLVTTGLASQALGLARLYDSSGSTFVDAVVTWNGVGSTFLVLSPLDGSNIDIGPTSPFTFANGDSMSALVTVPVAEWVGSGSNFGPGASVQLFSSTTGTWDAAAAAGNTVAGYSTISGALTATRDKVVRLPSAPQSISDVKIVFLPSGNTAPVGTESWAPYVGQSAADFGARIVSVVGTDVTVRFFQYKIQGSVFNSTTGAGNWTTTDAQWALMVANPSAPVGQVLASTDGREGLYKAGSAPGLIPTSTTITAAPLAGSIGETLEASGGTLGTTTIGSTGANTSICGVTLTPGVWEVQGGFYIVAGATTAWSEAAWGISSTNNGIDSLAKGGWGQVNGFQTLCPVNKAFLSTTGTRRFNAITSTSVYLVASITYSVLGGAAYGGSSYIKAVRIA
jgi:hypothetical protein